MKNTHNMIDGPNSMSLGICGDKIGIRNLKLLNEETEKIQMVKSETPVVQPVVLSEKAGLPLPVTQCTKDKSKYQILKMIPIILILLILYKH